MQRAPAEPRKCRYCPRILAARGIVSHERKHEREAASAEQLAALAQAEITRGLNSLGFIGFTGDSLLPSNGIDDIQSANVGQPTNQEGVIHDLTDHAPPNRTWSPPPMVGVDSGPTQAIPDATPLEETRETAPEVPPPQRLASEAEDVVRQLGRVAEEDDICVEKHPRSGEGIKYYSYDDYSKQSSQPLPPPPTASQNSSTNETPKRMPWFPFQSRVDFLLAEFMQDLRLNAKEIDRLLDIVHMILSDPPGGFNLASAKHVASTWKIATESSDVTLVRKSLDDLDYAGEPVSIDVWVRPLWDWCLELVDNPDIVSQFHWNAEKISRHDGVEFVRFFNEPWTGNTWWEIQLQLPGDASPIFIVLYADKTKLSSFGTRKGYPVYVRCANLPANIRNGKGLAGGRLVGWLPILPEETDKAKKSSFINFKRIVWHKSFAKILESIKVYAKEGFWHKCGDGIWRRLFPIILILSADYEEMCMMSATRGHGSACPCPICLVPLDRLMDVTETFELRTTESMMAVYREAKDARLASEKEDILKKVGLRFVENCFWELAYTDVYPAQSFDRLHAYHSGVFKHLLNEFLAVFDSLSRPSRTSVEKSLKEFPRWRDLNHFTEIAKFREFSDGRKYEDLSKVIIFASHHEFMKNDTGYHLLQWMRSYLELDMYASLRSHSATTIAMGRQEMVVFETAMKDDWNFPKIHTHSHMFSDIENKGVTVNYNTKFNENMHGDVKDYYWDLSNFRDVDPIIVRAVSEHVTCMAIREAIDAYDADQAKALVQKATASVREADANRIAEAAVQPALADSEVEDDELARFKIGSAVKDISLAQLKAHISPTYHGTLTGFLTKLNRRLTQMYGQSVRISESNLNVTLYRYIGMDYVSMEDSQDASDILRMNPDFHHRERYDCALVAVPGGFIIARLIGIFEVVHNGRRVLVALILPFDEPVVGLTAAERKRDQDLRFTRIRARPMEKSAFIPVNSIVRGALVVPDASSTSSTRDFILMDVVDADFWLRLRLGGLATQLKERANL